MYTLKSDSAFQPMKQGQQSTMQQELKKKLTP